MSDDQSKSSLLGGLRKLFGGKRSANFDAAGDSAPEAATDEELEAADNAADPAEDAALDAPVPLPEQNFTIRLAVEEEGLERVRDLLLEDERITGIEIEITPADPMEAEDKEPVRNALRVACTVADLGEFMEEVRAILRRRLRAVDYHHVSIDRY